MMAAADPAGMASVWEIAPATYRLAVPTPFAVGAVNAYLLAGTPLTLIDGGPNIATSLLELERLVRTCGYELADIELLLITHQHMDHEGLTAIVAERSGAEVACLRPVADYLGAQAENQLADDRFAQALMRRHGIEPQVVDALASVASIVVGLGAPVAATRRLEPGELIEAGGRTLRALHRPGHSPGDTVFVDEASGVMFSGDHLLGHISSNALVTGKLQDGVRTRTRPLLEYRESLIATGKLELEITLPGHGEAISDHRALIARRLEGQQLKAERIHALLRERPLSAHELASALYGRVAFSQAFLALSEVLGHLDLLIEDGLVSGDEDAQEIIFHAT
jgi:glyoxylase-like metal-dependent hydrolase (beta-lactamase superfamily II)